MAARATRRPSSLLADDVWNPNVCVRYIIAVQCCAAAKIDACAREKVAKVVVRRSTRDSDRKLVARSNCGRSNGRSNNENLARRRPSRHAGARRRRRRRRRRRGETGVDERMKGERQTARARGENSRRRRRDLEKDWEKKSLDERTDSTSHLNTTPSYALWRQFNKHSRAISLPECD